MSTDAPSPFAGREQQQCNPPPSTSGNGGTSSGPSTSGVASTDGTVPYPVYLRDSHQAASQGDPLVSIQLEQTDLWEEFKTCPTEMVITRQGRRMFPVVTVTVKGLRPEAMYSVFMDLILVDNHRWRYVRGKWMSSGKADQPHGTIYRHPDSPHYGSHWMKSPIAFNRVKLTNRMGEGGHLVLNSLHKYEARVHVVPEQGQRIDRLPCNWTSFPATQFIAVTAYQNEDLTRLKILRNPYAKAFTEKKTRVGVSEEHFSGGLQFIQPHMPFSDQLGEDMDGGDASEQEECVSPPPVVMPSGSLSQLASFEQEMPQGSLSAPGTLKREEEMDIDEANPRQSRSLPVDSEPQNLPSAYYIRDKSGQITVCGQVVRPEDLHLQLAGLSRMADERGQPHQVQHSPAQPSHGNPQHQPQQAHVSSQHVAQSFSHPHQSPPPQVMQHFSPGDSSGQQAISPPTASTVSNLQSPSGHMPMVAGHYPYNTSMPSSPPSQAHGVSYQQMPAHLPAAHSSAGDGQLQAGYRGHGNPVSPPAIPYLQYPLSQGGTFPQGGTLPIMAANGAMHPLLQAQYAAAAAAAAAGALPNTATAALPARSVHI